MPVRVANKRRNTAAKPKLKPALSLKIEGPGIRKGRVPIPELIQICEEAQNAINKQAEALKKKRTYHPGPVGHSIQEECTLELIGIHGNSPTTLDFDLRKPERSLDFHEEFGEKAIKELISGTRKKKQNGFDPGVLRRMYNLTGVFTKETISKIEMIAISRNGHDRRLSVVLNETVRNRFAKQLSTPRKAVLEVVGVLDMADFKPEDFQCRIDTPIGASVRCKFDPSKADEIQRLLRHNVRVKGEGKINPYTDKVEMLQIDEIAPASFQALADQSFFANPSLADLVAASDAKPLDDPSILSGWIPDDEDVDAMVKEIYDARK